MCQDSVVCCGEGFKWALIEVLIETCCVPLTLLLTLHLLSRYEHRIGITTDTDTSVLALAPGPWHSLDCNLFVQARIL